MRKVRIWKATFFSNGFLLGAGIVSGVLLARMLGAEDRGLLTAITYWPHFIVGVLAMGVNEGVVLQVASRGKSKTIVATTVTIAIILAVLAAIACWILLSYYLLGQRSEYLGFARIYAIILAPTSYVCLFLLAIYHGQMRFNEFNVVRVMQTAIYPSALALFWLAGCLTVETAAVAALLGGLVVSLILVSKLSANLSARPNLAEGKEIARKSVRLHFVNLLMTMTEQVDKIILVMLSSNHQLGNYVVAYTAAAAGSAILTQTFINIMLPAAARTEGAVLRYQEIIRSLRILLLTVLVLTGVMIAALPLLLPAAFGAEFREAVPYAQVLSIALGLYGVRKCMIYILRSWEVSRPAVSGEAMASLCVLAGGYLAFVKNDVIGLCWLLVVAQLVGTVIVWRGFLTTAQNRMVVKV